MIIPGTEIEIDIFSFVPAVFGAGLSIYNWLMTRKPASISIEPLIEYGAIYSHHAEATKLILPFIFHNDGAQRGLISRIKFGFKVNDKERFIPLNGRAKLLEIDEDTLSEGGYRAFEENGYKYIQPTYPINVEALESTSVVMIANAWHVDGIFPINKKATCVIIADYGKNKQARVEFPFFLDINHCNLNDFIVWYPPISKHPDADSPDYKEEDIWEASATDYDRKTFENIEKVYGST